MFSKKRFDLYDLEAHNDPYKANFLPHAIETQLESPQAKNHLLNAADEIFVYGVNSSSELLVVRIARTVNHEAEAWIYLKLKDGKVYELHKTLDYQNSCSDIGREFTCGGLKMHYISPMRRWRIFYNGLLREISEDDSSANKLVYVKFAFIWSATSDLFDMAHDISTSALALGIARCKWKSFSPPIKKFQDTMNSYAQAGVVHGTVSIEEEIADRKIYLFGERVRFLGNTILKNGAQFTHALGHISKNGSIIHISTVTIPDVVKESV